MTPPGPIRILPSSSAVTVSSSPRLRAQDMSPSPSPSPSASSRATMTSTASSSRPQSRHPHQPSLSAASASSVASSGQTVPPPVSSDRRSGGSLSGTHRTPAAVATAAAGDATPPPSPAKVPRLPLNRAMLSRVAPVFRSRIKLGTHTRDGIEYHNCFVGRDAVDVLAALLRSPDRNLALLVGRSLDAQRFFHHVSYSHRLRDSPYELYMFPPPLPPMPMPLAPPAELMPAAGGGGSGASLDRAPSMVVKFPAGMGPPSAAAGVAYPTPTSSAAATASENPESSSAPTTAPGSPTMVPQSLPVPTGFFTLLSECYSPTCSSDRLCYSTVCPRQMAQRALLGLPLPTADNGGPEPVPAAVVAESEPHGWSAMVPEAILNAASEREVKRQEAIFELVVTEETFVEDLELVEKLYMDTIVREGYLPRERTREFVRAVFGNVGEIRETAKRLAGALVRRQQEKYVVARIGDVFRMHVAAMEAPIVAYAATHPWAKHHLEAEIAYNPELGRFLAETERLPQTRRLPIQSFLGRPISRIARYPLLLGAIAKQTPPDHPDQVDLAAAIADVKVLLGKVNAAAGHADNAVRLLQLHHQFVYKTDAEEAALALLDPARRLVREGTLRRVGGDDLAVFLLDHALVFCRRKKAKYDPNNGWEYRLYRPPIPLHLLRVDTPDEAPPLTPLARSRAQSSASLAQQFENGNVSAAESRASSLGLRAGTTVANALTRAQTAPLSAGGSSTNLLLGMASAASLASTNSGGPGRAHGGTISPASAALATTASASASSTALALGNEPTFTVTRLGRAGYSLTLAAASGADRRQWVETLTSHARDVTSASAHFRLDVLADMVLPADARPAGSAPLDDAAAGRLLVATDRGVYAVGGGATFRAIKVVDIDRATQVEVLTPYAQVLVLADRVLYTVPLAAVLHRAIDPAAPLAKARRVSGVGTVHFFRVGLLHDAPYVCTVRPASMSSTLKVYEPMVPRKKASGPTGTLARLFRGGSGGSGGKDGELGDATDALRLFTELYVPSEAYSVHWLRSKLHVGCGRGFEVLDPVAGDHATLFDADDPFLEFIHHRSDSNAVRPMAIFRVPFATAFLRGGGAAPGTAHGSADDLNRAGGVRDSYVSTMGSANGNASSASLPAGAGKAPLTHLYLVCYADFALYVSRSGRRARPEWWIEWDGEPRHFAVVHPFVVGFGAKLVEVWHLETGERVQIIPFTSDGGLVMLDSRANAMVCAALGGGGNGGSSGWDGSPGSGAHVVFKLALDARVPPAASSLAPGGARP
ncbi:RHO1 GDP-GTP exchange protein 2 [Blastocladiella emersonii ATCC 22665]|nr:RHO1 GDP-GTP exchange protein 2 [Blastocladiella emersonii ATCC 22665]